MTARFLIPVIISALNLACSTEQAAIQQAAPTDDYSTGFPKGAGFDLEEALPAVQMLSSVGYYRQANFGHPDGWPVDKPMSDSLWQAADTVTTFTKEVVGTATVVQFSMGRVAIVTSAHVVSFQDTVTTFYRDASGQPLGVKAKAVLVKRKNYLAAIPGADTLEILALDDRFDIAILGQPINTDEITTPVSTLLAGQAADLKWGSFVYAVGYPVGFQMISSGIVSQPMRDKNGSFLTNVVFNRGMSGAAVLATRPGSRQLEWVGVMTSGAAGTEYVLTPEKDDRESDALQGEPYQGESFVSKVQRIRYGVSTSVSIDEVIRMARKHASIFEEGGYKLSILD